MTVVTNPEDNTIQGVITDGDIRKYLAIKGTAVFEMTAADIMTKDPVTIVETAFAAQAVSLMEHPRGPDSIAQKAITALPVVGRDGTLMGVIHMHHILSR